MDLAMAIQTMYVIIAGRISEIDTGDLFAIAERLESPAKNGAAIFCQVDSLVSIFFYQSRGKSEEEPDIKKC